ncbi:MAG: tetratricopeptide repeat protein [Desulfovibrionaceae bacterium]
MSDQETQGQKQSPERGRIEGVGRDKIKGVFSTQTVEKVGTGTTQRKSIQKTYWFCEEKGEDTISVQPLNRNYVPSGPMRSVPKEDFLSKFNPEPEFYVQTVFPKMRELDKTIKRGEDHREAGRVYSAEMEFQQAVDVDEENVRANFGLGLTYLDRGDSVKANDIFERLVNLDAAFAQEHKHLFNDFGINLRKNRMMEQALEYYRRAESLEANDENLFHNIARVYFEMGDLEKCVHYLERSLEINPNMEEGKRFMEYLEKQGYIVHKPDGGRELRLAPGSGQPAQKRTKPSDGKPINVDGGVKF